MLKQAREPNPGFLFLLINCMTGTPPHKKIQSASLLHDMFLFEKNPVGKSQP